MMQVRYEPINDFWPSWPRRLQRQKIATVAIR